jgi:glycosyltransferase involved in cell wall biosynthesis
MKVLLVAPRICTPWTEGRKKLVRDLISQTEKHWQLCGLVTVDAGETFDSPPDFASGVESEGKDHLLYLVRNLEQVIALHKPDMVCHFPFGAFTGLRGIGNLWVISRITRICRKLHVPCCTIMYSLTSEANTFVHRFLLSDVYFNQYSRGKRGIRFGVKLPDARQLYSPQSRTLLFMSGAAMPTLERFNYVLNTRGLRYLLKAGGTLRKLGFKLIVAIPFFKHEEMRNLLQHHPDNSWDPDDLIYRDEVKVPDIFHDIRAFVFPYGHEEQQFVPTSIVEAMHFGVPVVLPRLNFLAQFHTGVEKSLVYEPGDVDDLTSQIQRLDSSPARILSISNTAKNFVATEYNIENTVLDIERIYHELKERAGTAVPDKMRDT